MNTKLTKNQAIACYLFQSLGQIDSIIEKSTAHPEIKSAWKYLPALCNKGIAEKLDAASYGRGCYRINAESLYEAFDNWRNDNWLEYENMREKCIEDLIIMLG